MNAKHLFLLAFMVLVSVSCAHKNEQEPLLTTVEATLKMDFTVFDGFDDKIFLDNADKLKELGCTYKDGVVNINVKFPNADVLTANGTKLRTDENAQVDLRSLEATLKERLDVVLGNQHVTLLLKGEEYVIDSEFFFGSMDGGCCSTSQKVRSSDGNSGEQEVPRCKDYNGPLGNGKNDQATIQAAINFIGSDCFYAVARGMCVDEHTNGKGGCYRSHGGKLCTELINKQ